MVNENADSGITSIPEAMAAAMARLKEQGITPMSPEGKKVLAQVISSAGQAFNNSIPLPGTRSNEEIANNMNSRKQIEEKPLEITQE